MDAEGPALIWNDPAALNLDVDEKHCRELGLISVWEGGLRIGRQFCGHHCLPVDTFGAFVSLGVQSEKIQRFLFDKYRGSCTELESAEIEVVRQQLVQCGMGQVLEIEEPGQNYDGWMEIQIIARLSTWPPEIRIGPGVLTWESFS